VGGKVYSSACLGVERQGKASGCTFWVPELDSGPGCSVRQHFKKKKNAEKDILERYSRPQAVQAPWGNPVMLRGGIGAAHNPSSKVSLHRRAGKRPRNVLRGQMGSEWPEGDDEKRDPRPRGTQRSVGVWGGTIAESIAAFKKKLRLLRTRLGIAASAGGRGSRGGGGQYSGRGSKGRGPGRRRAIGAHRRLGDGGVGPKGKTFRGCFRWEPFPFAVNVRRGFTD